MVNTSDLKARFGQVFGDSRPEFHVVAPGRVNLIGEHTDYNDGFVLPIAMSQALHVLGGRAPGDRIEVHSTMMGQTVSLPVSDPGGPGEPTWANYVRGVASLLADEGIRLAPCRLLIDSEVPIGGGVSSSAALEIGTALAIMGAAGQRMDPIKVALLARQAEHRWAGSPCGIMDQFICVLGKRNHALLLDCRSQAYEQLPLELTDDVLIVCDTQVKHEIGSSEYPVRQEQCREGLKVLKKANPGLESLRDVAPEMLEQHQGEMDDVIYRRCRHVVTEIARTVEAAKVLRDGDLTTFGQLMFGSHVSLRDDYGVSCKELDFLVEIASRVPGVHGARMTGGGFGGCAIVLARSSAVDPLREAISNEYDGAFDKPAIVYTTKPSEGAMVEPISA